MVALLDRGDALANIDDDAGALMAENGGEEAFRIAPERVKSSVWQMPVALTSINTSPAFGPSSCTVITSSGFPA